MRRGKQRGTFHQSFKVGEEVIFELEYGTRVHPFPAVVNGFNVSQGKINLTVDINGKKSQREVWYKHVRKK